MTRTRTVFAAFAVALALLAGCSGTDDEKDAATPTTAPGAVGVSTTVRPVDTSFSGQGSAQFCEQARAYKDRSAGVSANLTPAELRVSAKEAQAALGEAQRSAPAEIKNDVVVLGSSFGAFLSELEKVNFEVDKLPPAAVSGLQSPEFQASTTRFEAYLRSVCRIGR